MTAERPAALVFAGGLGLGAYHLGALEALIGGGVEPVAVAGSSIGAVTAAIVAGNPPGQALAQLDRFWAEAAGGASDLWQPPGRHLRAWTAAAGARLAGAPGLFRPRPWLEAAFGPDPALYDHRELAGTLTRLADFERLNAGGVRCCIGTTDLETGQAVLFDTAAGDRIAPEHVVASGALPPNFPAVIVEGRVLGDGGLSCNLPFEPLLATGGGHPPPPPLVILLDLFAPDATPPRSLEAAAARAVEVQFAAQTAVRLAGVARERALAARLGGADPVDVLWLSYRASSHEAGPERQFDFSAETLRERRAAGAADAAEALARLDALPAPDGLRITRIRRSPPA